VTTHTGPVLLVYLSGFKIQWYTKKIGWDRIHWFSGNSVEFDEDRYKLAEFQFSPRKNYVFPQNRLQADIGQFGQFTADFWLIFLQLNTADFFTIDF
jgi:hypothetical protein